jgi:hypothetical protein
MAYDIALRALLFGLIAAGCMPSGDRAATAPPEHAAPAAPPRRYIVTGLFGACTPDCKFNFGELEATSPKITRTYCRNAEPSCITFEGTLTPSAREQLTAIGKQLAALELERSYGCGACVDGVDNKLVLVHDDGRLSEHSYDASFEEARVPELEEVHRILSKAKRALHECQSNDVLEVLPGCTPYDQLDPRPHSRP